MRTKMKELLQKINGDDVAIIGMACHFPKSIDIQAYWKNLTEGNECISRYSDDELKLAGVSESLYQDPRYVKASGSIDGIEEFDSKFFEFSPREAALIDPQHRLFLEQTFKALEDANCNPETYQGLIGVYASAGMNTYLYNNLLSHRELMEESGGYPVMISSDKDFLATRTSYKLNLKGPSITVQTACSSSLVAIHCACQALRSGECDCAVAGGVSLRVPQKTGYLYQDGLILSPDGHCRAFDDSAMGTVFGSGAGVIVLKMLSEALEEGDSIYAVIKGSAINNDGSRKAGYTAPGMESQAAAIYEAMSVSGVKPSDISYVETHGTGTAIGDPIEIAALTRAFTAEKKQALSCAIGSVKTNIGHLDAAAGVAGVIKTALMLQHGQIPASLNFETPNTKIDFKHSPFYVNTKLTPWAQNGTKRCAGVSSFGIGGTNAHLILQEAPELVEEVRTFDRQRHSIFLSAKSAGALLRKASELADFLSLHQEALLEDTAFTLVAGRKAMSHRFSFACASKEEAIKALLEPDINTVFRGVEEGAGKEMAFVFPGQGSQYVNMGSGLYHTEKIFKETMDHCFSIVNGLLETDLKKIIYPSFGEEEDAARHLNSTRYTQPALFILEYSLSKLLISWGILPKAMIGHSLGEYVAACLSGVFTLEEALSLVTARARLISSLPEGSMFSVELEEEKLLPLLVDGVSIAAVNGENYCVLSGINEAVGTLMKQLSGMDITVRELDTSHAFHSGMLDPILPAFGEVIKKIKFKKPSIPYLSACTGEWITDEDVMQPDYWIRHMRQTVRFHDASAKLLEIPDMVLLEVGPGKSLSSLLRRHPAKEKDKIIINTLPHQKEKSSSDQVLCEAVARLFAAGAAIDWRRYYESGEYRKLRLPVYSFDRRRCFIEPRIQTVERQNTSCFTKEFRKKDAAAAQGSRINNCLILAGQHQISGQLQKVLRDTGNHVLSIRKGIDDKKEYATLIQESGDLNQYANQVVYLWGLEEQKKEFEHLEKLTALIYFLESSNIRQKVHLTVILQKSVDISGSEDIDYNAECLHVFLRAVRQKCQYVSIQIIDVDHLENEESLGQIAERLAAEITEEPADELVAYRMRTRWVMDYESYVQKDKSILFLSIMTPSENGEWLISQIPKRGYWSMMGRDGKTVIAGTKELDLTKQEEFFGLKTKLEEAGISPDGIVYQPIRFHSDINNSFDMFDEKEYSENITKIKKEMQNIEELSESLNPDFVIVLGGFDNFGFENGWLESYTGLMAKTSRFKWIYMEYDAKNITDEEAEISLFDDRADFTNAYAAPQNQTEMLIVKVWEDILGTKPIGVLDNFFELGGTSLMITQIVTGIGKKLGAVSLTVKELYENQTVRDLANYIETVRILAQTREDSVNDNVYEEGEV